MKNKLLAVAAGLSLLSAGTIARAEGDMNTPRTVKTEAIQPAADEDAAKEATKPAPKPDQTFARRLFGSEVTETKKSYVCFVRHYDPVHLAQHPQQTVKLMKLLLTAEVVPEDAALNYGFRMGLKLRKKSGDYGTGGSCGHAKATADDEGREHIGCGVDCDGGGLTVELTEDNKSVLVKLDSIRIGRNDDQNDEGNNHLGDKDDKVFRLDRAPIEQCKSLANDDEEKAVMLRQ